MEGGFCRAAGDAGYSDSFIEHCLVPIIYIYPAGLTRSIQFWLADFVILINAAIGGWFLYQSWVARSNAPNRSLQWTRKTIGCVSYAKQQPVRRTTELKG
jgi:hypothetical protein